MRLNRLLARAGVTSRRRAEVLIRAGRVRVNGRVVRDPARCCDPARDRVEVDGQRLRLPRSRVVIALNKPAGYATTLRDPHGGPALPELLRGAPAGLHPVGRLDKDSRGLLLLTNDGELTARLTHPRFHVPKTYRVRVAGRPSEAVLADLRRGIPLADGLTAPAQVAVLGHGPGYTDLEVTLWEGRNRQLRRMLATVGHEVLDLQRVAVGPIRLGDLPEGRWRTLTPEEARALRAAVGQSDEQAGGAPVGAR